MKKTAWTIVAFCVISSSGLYAEEPPPLHEVKAIYVRPMSNDLDEALIQQLLKWDAIKVAFEANKADAVLIGGSDSRVVGVGTAIGPITATRVEAEVTLLDPETSKSIWSTKKSGGRGLLSVAEEIVKQLKKDWEKAAEKKKKSDG